MADADIRTMFDRIWDAHVVETLDTERSLVYVDRHLIHEGTTAPAFDRLRRNGAVVRRPDLTFGVIDHGVSTAPGRTLETWRPTLQRSLTMQANCAEFGIELMDLDDPRQGIVHVVAPELGVILPGATVVCGDSHTSTCGGLGAWAWGIGTSEVHHMLENQVLIQRRPRTLRIWVEGRLGNGVTPKDLILHLIGTYGAGAGIGHVVEYAGPAIRDLSVEGRLTICNMSIEMGARAGLIGVDDTTLNYLDGRPFAPKGELWERATRDWLALNSPDEARFDREIRLDVSTLAPQVTWGTSPEHAVAIDARSPDPAATADPERRRALEQALAYMGLVPGQPLEGVPIDYAFIGSCTNSRLSDLQAAARIVAGRKVAAGVTAWVVPGSSQVKRAAEALGLDCVFRDAGFQWRESGCSMCVATNGETVAAGKRCISTSNRNFEDRQGAGSRTHLASPAMVAAAAVTGRITDVRRLRA